MQQYRNNQSMWSDYFKSLLNISKNYRKYLIVITVNGSDQVNYFRSKHSCAFNSVFSKVFLLLVRSSKIILLALALILYSIYIYIVRK